MDKDDMRYISNSLKEISRVYIFRISNWIKSWAFIVVLLGWFLLIVGLFGMIDGNIPYPSWLSAQVIKFHRDISANLVSIGVTVLLINFASEQRDKEKLKAQLLRQANSKDNGFALLALEELKANRWLGYDTFRNRWFRGANLEGAELLGVDLHGVTMHWVNLRKTNLHGADFEKALLWGVDFRGADMQGVDLKGANLTRCNLEGVHNLTDAQLEETNRLWGTIMPNGNRYDGRFRLRVDIKSAIEMGLDIDDAQMMARYYSYDGPMDASSFNTAVLGRIHTSE